jgi:glycosyltransferase involved in cell wall biosynthesis
MDRVRLLPGLPDHRDVPGLFEAADIVPLPYLESYGSAQLLLAMQFGKVVLATAVGGMDEYLAGSKRAVLLRGPEPEHVAAGLECALRRLEVDDAGAGSTENLERFDWRRIAARLLAQIEAA